MHNLIPTQTMSSREIAQLTGKEHKNVLCDIRTTLNKLDLSTAEFSAMYKADNGQQYHEFLLPKRECLILVSGYSIELRAKIIDRWQELENKNNYNLPKTFSEALMLAANQAKQLELQAPKVTYYDALVERENLTCIRDTAKELGITQTEFVKYLLDHGYVYRDAAEQLKPYAKHAELFKLKEFTKHNHSGIQTLVTVKGKTKFAAIFASKVAA